MARLGTFEDLMMEAEAYASDSARTVSRALRTMILEGLPEAVEVVRLGDKAATYGVGEKKMSESHVYIRPAAEHVNLGFWHGVGLPDPGRRLEGTGKKMRHVKVRTLADAHSPELRQLVDAALAERRRALGLD